MKTIWKYELENISEQTIEIPHDSTLLDVQVQNGMPCIWALVDPDNIKCTRRLVIWFLYFSRLYMINLGA